VLFPVRCFTCGAVIGHLWEKYLERVQRGENSAKVLDDLGVKRYCCRRMFLSHIEISREILRFPKIS